MSDSKHTAWPWKTKLLDYGSIAILADDRQIAVVQSAMNSLGVGEKEANARLIAAAPELLAALEAVLHFDRDPSIPGEYKHDVTLAMKVRNAIAKATRPKTSER